MKKALLILLLFANSAGASEPLNVSLKYHAHWSGFKVAELRAYIKQEDGKYSYRARIDTMGVVKLTSKYWSDNSVVGLLKKNKHLPEKYNTEWRRKKENQKIEVSYKNGSPISEKAEPPENRNKRPLVAPKDKAGAVDPITAAIMAREKIIALVEGKKKLPAKFTVPVFDARRRQTITVEVIGYEDRNFDDIRKKTLHIKFWRTAGPGFNQKEKNKMAEQEPVFDAYLDNNYFPELVIAKTPKATATAQLEQVCWKSDCNLDE